MCNKEMCTRKEMREVMSEQEVRKTDLEMVTRVMKELKARFDPDDKYSDHEGNTGLFEFQMKTDNEGCEAWRIVFLGNHTVMSGWQVWDEPSEDAEEYIAFDAQNEQKILILAVTNTINVITNFMEFIFYSGISSKNKRRWIDILKGGIEEEEI